MLLRMHPTCPTAPLIALLCCLSANTLADSLLSWEQLSAYCQSPAPDEQARCQGYIMGAADAGALCIPPNIKPSTLQDLALSTTITDPAERPTQALQQRLQDIFPCPVDTTQSQPEQAPETDSTAPQRSENWSNKKRIGK